MFAEEYINSRLKDIRDKDQNLTFPSISSLSSFMEEFNNQSPHPSPPEQVGKWFTPDEQKRCEKETCIEKYFGVMPEDYNTKINVSFADLVDLLYAFERAEQGKPLHINKEIIESCDIAIESCNHYLRKGINEFNAFKQTLTHIKHLAGAEQGKQEAPGDEKEACLHFGLVDTGVGYFFCRACRQSWTYDEYRNRHKDIPSKGSDYVNLSEHNKAIIKELNNQRQQLKEKDEIIAKLTPTPVLQSIEGKEDKTPEEFLKEIVFKSLRIDVNKENWFVDWWMVLDPQPSLRLIIRAMEEYRQLFPATLPAKDKTNEAGERKFSLEEALEIFVAGAQYSLDQFDTPNRQQYFKEKFNIDLGERKIK